jgi:hypothetical protein
MLLAGFAVVMAAALELTLRRPRALWPLILWPGATFLLVWILCRQNPLNLPAYVRHSLDISSGYEQAMGLPTSTWALACGLPILLGLVAYAMIHLAACADRYRALARCLVLGAFVYINWKHGFIRADGHLIGFYIAALVPITAFPALLDDPPKIHWLRWVFFVPAIGVCLAGLQDPLPVTRNIVNIVHERIVNTVHNTLNIGTHLANCREKLRAQREEWDLPLTRVLVGKSPIDLITYNTAIVLHNRFNYQPRPVLQSYLAYTPGLIELNAAHYASERAPDFVLFKLEVIDGRYPPLDDSRLLYLFMHRYEYVHTEKHYQLWRRKPGSFDAAGIAPRPLRTTEINLNQPHQLGAEAGKLLWARVEIRRSLLGRLHDFLYKASFVQIRLLDDKGRESYFRLPLPQARAGFMLSPVIDDDASYMRFASGQDQRSVRELSIIVAESDRKFFNPSVQLELSELTPSQAGEKFLRQIKNAEFPGFKDVPASHEAKTPISVADLDGRKAVVLHAPSEMVFRIPRSARHVTGFYGYLPGAYQNGGKTNGAEFVIYWSNGSEKNVLFRQYLNPVENPADRGWHNFEAPLPERPDGRLYLQVLPGPEGNIAWDWTVWGEIDLRPASPTLVGCRPPAHNRQTLALPSTLGARDWRRHS